MSCCGPPKRLPPSKQSISENQPLPEDQPNSDRKPSTQEDPQALEKVEPAKEEMPVEPEEPPKRPSSPKKRTSVQIEEPPPPVYPIDRERPSVQKILIPRGMINPNETTIIEIPSRLSTVPLVIAKRKIAPPPDQTYRPRSPQPRPRSAQPRPRSPQYRAPEPQSREPEPQLRQPEPPPRQPEPPSRGIPKCCQVERQPEVHQVFTSEPISALEDWSQVEAPLDYDLEDDSDVDLQPKYTRRRPASPREKQQVFTKSPQRATPVYATPAATAPVYPPSTSPGPAYEQAGRSTRRQPSSSRKRDQTQPCTDHYVSSLKPDIDLDATEREEKVALQRNLEEFQRARRKLLTSASYLVNNSHIEGYKGNQL